MTKSAGPYTSLQYDSDADESDMRIWIHAQHSTENKKYVLSPDICLPYYHIGLPLILSTEEIIIQLSRPSDKEMNILNLHVLIDLISTYPATLFQRLYRLYLCLLGMITSLSSQE